VLAAAPKALKSEHTTAMTPIALPNPKVRRPDLIDWNPRVDIALLDFSLLVVLT
jgi:hypothetical protein